MVVAVFSHFRWGLSVANIRREKQQQQPRRTMTKWILAWGWFPAYHPFFTFTKRWWTRPFSIILLHNCFVKSRLTNSPHSDLRIINWTMCVFFFVTRVRISFDDHQSVYENGRGKAWLLLPFFLMRRLLALEIELFSLDLFSNDLVAIRKSNVAVCGAILFNQKMESIGRKRR